jgi:hypothetical protein
MGAADMWIAIPNWDRFQHYKHRDPVWLRDYVRQLWNPQWLPLSLSQRGLLWTARLAYAHHNGQLRISELQSYTRNYERSSCAAIAERLSNAGLMGLCASTPLSLKTFSNTREDQDGHRPACPFCETGAGRHTLDCPTLEDPHLLVERLKEQL